MHLRGGAVHFNVQRTCTCKCTDALTIDARPYAVKSCGWQFVVDKNLSDLNYIFWVVVVVGAMSLILSVIQNIEGG